MLGQVGDEIHLYVVPATNLSLRSSRKSQEIAAAEIDRPFEDLKSASAASVEFHFVEISRVYCGVSRARCLCAWCVCARGGEFF